MLISPLQVEQLGFQFEQLPLITTSFGLVHDASQVFTVVTTEPPVHDVQVVCDISQVFQVESQARQLEPSSMVISDSQVLCQVLSLISNFFVRIQDVQVSTSPDQVIQLELHGIHSS